MCPESGRVCIPSRYAFLVCPATLYLFMARQVVLLDVIQWRTVGCRGQFMHLAWFASILSSSFPEFLTRSTFLCHVWDGTNLSILVVFLWRLRRAPAGLICSFFLPSSFEFLLHIHLLTTTFSFPIQGVLEAASSVTASTNPNEDFHYMRGQMGRR